MKISKQTIAILKAFSGLNQTFIQQEEGTTIRAITVQKNVVAHATIAESLPPFQVYDLKEFLSVLELFEDPDVQFFDKWLEIKHGKNRHIRYGYCAEQLVDPRPPLNVKFPAPDIVFTVSKEELASVQKASAALGVADVVIAFSSEGLAIGVEGAKNEGNQNSFWIEVEDFKASSDIESARIVFKPDVFRFIPANYEVSVLSKICQFKAKLGTEGPNEVTYWIGPDAKDTTVKRRS